jgi:hypothetical protein
MALSDAQIAALLAKPEPTRGGKRKAGIDYSKEESRTFENWFKLGSQLFDKETREPAKCENPDCPDVRERVDVVAELPLNPTIKICRICFMPPVLYGVQPDLFTD